MIASWCEDKCLHEKFKSALSLSHTPYVPHTLFPHPQIQTTANQKYCKENCLCSGHVLFFLLTTLPNQRSKLQLKEQYITWGTVHITLGTVSNLDVTQSIRGHVVHRSPSSIFLNQSPKTRSHTEFRARQLGRLTGCSSRVPPCVLQLWGFGEHQDTQLHWALDIQTEVFRL